MPVKFKSGKVLFGRTRHVSFCDRCDCSHKLGDPSPCSFPAGVDMPPCIHVMKFDFDACPECVTTVEDGVLPLVLNQDVEQWDTDDVDDTFANLTGRRLYGHCQLITDVPCHWELSVKCKEGASYYDVWVGEKPEGQTPVGTYVRTGGCDLTEQITVC